MDYELLLPLQRLRQLQWLPISPSWELPIALPQLGPSLAIVGVLPSLLLHFTWFCQSSAQTLNNSMFPSFSNRLDEAPVTNCNKFGYMARACMFSPGYDMGAKYLSTNDLCVYQIHNKLHVTTNNSLHRKFDISVYDLYHDSVGRLLWMRVGVTVINSKIFHRTHAQSGTTEGVMISLSGSVPCWGYEGEIIHAWLSFLF